MPHRGTAKPAARRKPGDEKTSAVTATQGLLSPGGVEGTRSPNISPSLPKKRKRRRVGDMRLLSLDGPPAASGAARQVKFSHDEVIADSAMASLDDFDFALGLMPLIDLDNGQAKAAGMAPSQAPGARYRNGDLVHLNGRIDGHIDDHTGGHIDDHTGGHIDDHTGGHADGHAGTHVGGHAGGHIDSHIDGTSARTWAPTSEHPPPMPPAIKNQITNKINELIATLRSTRVSSATNRTESQLVHVNKRIGEAVDGVLTRWQGDCVLEWFLEKATPSKIERNSRVRRWRANERFQRTLELIKDIQILLGVLED